MAEEFSGLDVALFTQTLLARLRAAGLVTDTDIIKIETSRLAAGLPLSSAETRLAYMLSDEAPAVVDVLSHDVDASVLEGRNRRVFLLLSLFRVRHIWDQLDEPQFYLEELLDEFDARNDYEEMRFFRKTSRRDRGWEKYVAQVDKVLEEQRQTLNSSARA